MSVPTDSASLRYTDPDGEHRVSLERACTSIGRALDQDLVLRESCVSRHHALITRQGGDYELVDQASTHGTFLNGSRIQRAILKASDTLQFGSLQGPKVRFHAVESGGKTEEGFPSLSGDLRSALTVLRRPAHQDRPAAGEMEQLSFLLNAARQLNAGGAITDIFHALLQLSIELTGVERGFVFLNKAGAMHLALGLDADGQVVEEDSTLSRRAMQKSIESESDFSVSDTLADDTAGAWASVLANDIRSIYCIPLRKRVSADEPNRLLGLLYLDSRIGTGQLSAIDHQVLGTLAMEAGTLLQNALLAEAEYAARIAAEELAIAAEIHSSLMSMTLPVLSYAVLQARSVPCRAIGGDFYDAVALNDCVCVTIADVSGKGVPASIVAATLQGIIHAQLLTGHSLADIAALVNTFLCARQVGKYATMVLLKLFPTGHIEYINCGHVRPLVVSGTEVRPLEEGNLVVGLIEGATYCSACCTLAPGERILLTTDGLTEAEDGSGEQFGGSGFDAVAHLQNLDEIMERVAAFQASSEAQDDWTLVDVRYEGA